MLGFTYLPKPGWSQLDGIKWVRMAPSIARVCPGWVKPRLNNLLDLPSYFLLYFQQENQGADNKPIVPFYTLEVYNQKYKPGCQKYRDVFKWFSNYSSMLWLYVVSFHLEGGPGFGYTNPAPFLREMMVSRKPEGGRVSHSLEKPSVLS